MMKPKDYTNSQLLANLINAAFEVCKRDSKAANAWLDRLIAEMAKRLQISDEELERIKLVL